MFKISSKLALILIGVLSFTHAFAQNLFPPGSVYKCKITETRVLYSDRPLQECIDREQQVYGSNGNLLGVLPPAAKIRALEEQLKREQEDQKRRAAIEGMLPSLLNKYPNAQAHDTQRQQDLLPLEEKLQTTNQQIEIFQAQLAELEEAKKSNSADTTIIYTRDRYDQLKKEITVQQNIASTLGRQIAAINKRYDEEKEILLPHWEKSPPNFVVVPQR